MMDFNLMQQIVRICFRPLVALAAYCKGETTIKGVSRLMLIKKAIGQLHCRKSLERWEFKIDLDDDIMTVHGGIGVKGATVHSRS